MHMSSFIRMRDSEAIETKEMMTDAREKKKNYQRQAQNRTHYHIINHLVSWQIYLLSKWYVFETS